MDKYLELMKTLPPLVAAIVWDVVNDRFTLETIELANKTTMEEFRKYDLVRCVAAGNPDYPPLLECKTLVDEMVEEMPEIMTK
jgi:hypothetical protein